MLKNSKTFVRIISFGMMSALVVLGVDVAIELRGHLALNQPISGNQLAHMLFEIFAVVTLAGGLLVVREHIGTLTRHNQSFADTLHALKDDFLELVERKLDHWALTAAERDVALLLLRGLTTSEIAELRGTSAGTVKLQSHALMKKSGTSSRSEFMALFLGQLMDTETFNSGVAAPPETN